MLFRICFTPFCVESCALDVHNGSTVCPLCCSSHPSPTMDHTAISILSLTCTRIYCWEENLPAILNSSWTLSLIDAMSQTKMISFFFLECMITAFSFLLSYIYYQEKLRLDKFTMCPWKLGFRHSVCNWVNNLCANPHLFHTHLTSHWQALKL